MASIGEFFKIGKAIQNANIAAMNRAAQSAVSAVSKFIREKYNIKKSDLDERIRVVTKASTENPSVTVRISKGDIALFKFSAKQIGRSGRPKKGKGPRTSQGVKATEQKGKRKLYRSSDNSIGSFIATMKSGHTGVFMRVSNEQNSKIKELFGVNLLQLVNPKSGQSKVYDTLEKSFTENYEKRLRHELDRRLK